tara:strand:+ start:73 stop:570 length:498 start_codon:yes stop_codon:yes gene_type:complete
VNDIRNVGVILAYKMSNNIDCPDTHNVFSTREICEDVLQDNYSPELARDATEHLVIIGFLDTVPLFTCGRCLKNSPYTKDNDHQCYHCNFTFDPVAAQYSNTLYKVKNRPVVFSVGGRECQELTTSTEKSDSTITKSQWMRSTITGYALAALVIALLALVLSVTL